MSEEAKKGKLSDFFRSVKRRFRKIIWPTKEDVTKQTGVVIAVTVVLGAIIAILDKVLLQVIDLIISI